MKIHATMSVDEKTIKSASGLENIHEAIDQEFGWLKDSGITVQEWSVFHKTQPLSQTQGKTAVLREIIKRAEAELNKNGYFGFMMPGGQHHIFIFVDKGVEGLFYVIEPNRIDSYGFAKSMGATTTANYNNFAELLIGCMWCMELFDADFQQQKSFSPERISIDVGYATLVAEKGTAPGYKEMFVGLVDKDGVWSQDLAVIGGKYHYDESAIDPSQEVVQDKGISVKVWADKDDEDYTHEFSIDVYEPEEELEQTANNETQADVAVIDTEKLEEYLGKEMILEFNSDKECMDYFNLYDGQNFKSVEEMKAYQGEYGFGYNGKWYHISFDEALDVRMDRQSPVKQKKSTLDSQIQTAASKASSDTNATTSNEKELK